MVSRKTTGGFKTNDNTIAIGSTVAVDQMSSEIVSLLARVPSAPHNPNGLMAP
ncbi:hypothetical protein Pla100_39450 [Neorhodopirellula pilleata]|uniref:Uncharacterized protein n=1 Tax=Neorhodopirellula pilleata TaxID=2714738 RepID=A0A5C6A346_9BACT|nr:hypothetical protein Pla100_39450 [Neorhodopirellula pilleata]